MACINYVAPREAGVGLLLAPFFRQISIVEFDGPASWSLDASKTGEGTKYLWVGALGLTVWG